MKKKKPKAFKVTGKVKWFLVKGPEDRCTTPKGGQRRGFEPGIYLENIKARKS